MKSSAYLQSWKQKKPSQIRLSGLFARSYDEDAVQFGPEREIRADAFVFAIQKCKDPEAWDALDLDQWEFYVASAEAIREFGYRSIGLPTLRRFANEPVPSTGLAGAVEAAAPRG